MTYVVVPKAVCAKYHHMPFSVLKETAEQRIDDLALVVDPTKEIARADGTIRVVEDNPYTVRGCLTFREGGRRDGFDRDDVATLHSQGW